MTTCAFVALLLSPTVSDAAEPGPTAAAASTAPAPRIEGPDALTLTGTAVWAGLQGQRVSVSVRNGNFVTGKLVAQDQSSIAIARQADGAVVAVPKSEIDGVRMFDPRITPDLPPEIRTRETGYKQYVGGALLLGFGMPIGIAGTAMLIVCTSCFYIHLPLLLPGLGMIIGGSRLMKKGTAAQAKFRKAWGLPVARMQVSPTLALGRSGGELGFSLRF